MRVICSKIGRPQGGEKTKFEKIELKQRGA